MSATATKATRRDLRRAMGSAAVGEIEQLATQVRTLRAAVANLEQFTGGHAESLARHQRALERVGKVAEEARDGKDHCRDLIDAINTRDAKRSTFWGRLRWLVTGK